MCSEHKALFMAGAHTHLRAGKARLIDKEAKQIALASFGCASTNMRINTHITRMHQGTKHGGVISVAAAHKNHFRAEVVYIAPLSANECSYSFQHGCCKPGSKVNIMLQSSTTLQQAVNTELYNAL